MSIIFTHTSRGYARVCAEAIVLFSKNSDNFKVIDYLEKLADLGECMRKHVKDSKREGVEVNDIIILEAEGILQEEVDKS